MSDHVTGEEEWSRPLVATLLWGLAAGAHPPQPGCQSLKAPTFPASAVMPRIPRRLDAFVAECAPLLSRLAEQDPAGPVPPALVGVVEAIQAEWGKEGGHAWERVGDELSALSLRILVGRVADSRGGE